MNGPSSSISSTDATPFSFARPPAPSSYSQPGSTDNSVPAQPTPIVGSIPQTGAVTGAGIGVLPMQETVWNGVGLGRKRRAASPTGLDPTFLEPDAPYGDESVYGHGQGHGHGTKRRRPNLAHGFSGLSISPETRKAPVQPIFGIPAAPDTPSGSRSGNGPARGQHQHRNEGSWGSGNGWAQEEVDDDDGLLPHERDVVIEELADQPDTDARRVNQHQHRHSQHHRHRPDQAKHRSAASYTGSLPFNSGEEHTYTRPGLVHMESSSSPSETSDAEDGPSVSTSPYVSRRPTIHADEIELPDMPDIPDHRANPAGAGYGGAAHNHRSKRAGQTGMDDDVQVEEVSISPTKPQPTFNFSYPHPTPLPFNGETPAPPPRTTNRRRGIKRRTSSVSEDGEGRQKKSRGMTREDMDTDMDADMGGSTGSAMGADMDDREIRGRRRGRTRYHEPEKDRTSFFAFLGSRIQA